MADKLEDVILGGQARGVVPESQLVGTFVGVIAKMDDTEIWFTIPSWDRGAYIFGPVRYAGTVLSGTKIDGVVSGGTITGSVLAGASVGDSCVVLLPGGDQEPWVLGWRK